MNTQDLQHIDPGIWQAIADEEARQRTTINLIASENLTSAAVREATGSCLTNKYAEGYPGRRYYGGCINVDVVENLAKERACALFGAEYANVQPHSGSQANMAVYFAAIKPGDTVLGMDLAHGGHLTHGSKVNFSGMMYNTVTYGVDPHTHTLDYEHIRRLAQEHKPGLIIAGASTYPRSIDFQAFRSIADETGALLLADMAHIAGLVATELHPSPVGQAHFVTSTSHKTMRGPRGGFILSSKEFGRALNSKIFPGMQGGPLMHVIAAKAVAFKTAMGSDFHTYQQRIVDNARALGRSLQQAGFSLLTGGTDNHLLLIDLRNHQITGQEAENLLDQAGITVNKNAIPFDPTPPAVTSGIRLGTPLVTTRGMNQDDMATVAGWIQAALNARGDQTALNRIKGEVQDFASSFPVTTAG
ncbi:MAG: serine hydroxymethyltransferase [Desulfovermiculus sp.]|nr:serine hydroxymethyltransferase [Desulfovermiculus sp.]